MTGISCAEAEIREIDYEHNQAHVQPICNAPRYGPCRPNKKRKGRFGASKAVIPLDRAEFALDAWKDIVIGFNGDPYKGMSRSVPNQKGH